MAPLTAFHVMTMLVFVAPEVPTPVGAGRLDGGVPLLNRSTIALMAAICGPLFFA